ncbi:MAG: DUF2493 domain-containing protein [Clostridia bacterium]|nr:DUF2493 domain-containing protein [Clostridia bacterium]
MRILVCGGRDFSDYEKLRFTLDEIISGKVNIEIVSGHAKGADELGEKYALEKGYPVRMFYPEWGKFGKAAGIIRNREMLEYIGEDDGIAVAFWDGVSSGTAFTIKEAKSKGIKLHVIRYNSELSESQLRLDV